MFTMFQGNETRTATSVNWLGYRIAAWIGQFTLTIATAIILVRIAWQAVVILLIFLVASFIFVWKDRYFPTSLYLMIDGNI